MPLKPNSRPKMSRKDCEKIIAHFKLSDHPCVVVAVRGYYLDSMGKPGVNDRGVYDDAAFVVTPETFTAVNWNTDASSYRQGYGTGAEKGMAMLAIGVWDYMVGAHKGRRPAGVQAGEVIVMRDGNKGSYVDKGWFGINHHWGSEYGTSSLGCQTAPPEQFPDYIGAIVNKVGGKGRYKYILIDEVQRKEILAGAPAKPVESKDYDLTPALDIIKEFEGLYLKAYRDPVGIITIGYGTIIYPDGRKVQMGDVITKEEALKYLAFEVNEKTSGVDRMVKVPMSNNERCALISFAYNCGTEALRGSTLLRRINAGETKTAVADEFLKWTYAGGKQLAGLVRRRKDERTLFLA